MAKSWKWQLLAEKTLINLDVCPVLTVCIKKAWAPKLPSMCIGKALIRMSEQSSKDAHAFFAGLVYIFCQKC